MDISETTAEHVQMHFLSTKIHTLELCCEWKIQNFSLCTKETGEYLVSPTFSFSDNKLKWYLVLYPKGKVIENQNYLSLYLHLNSLEGLEKIKVKYEFHILDNIKGKHFERNNVYIYEALDSVGFLRYVQRNAIMNEMFLPNDCLTIVCNVTAGLNNITSQTTALNNNAIDQKPQLQLLNNYESLFCNQKLCDVAITTSDKKIYAHKTILAAHSRVFMAMFESDMKEKRESEIEIKDVKFDVLQELLRFIYCGKIENFETLVIELLVAADKYAIKELSIKCEQYLQSTLNSDNVLNILCLADKYNSLNLKKSAIDFFIANRKGIKNINDFAFSQVLKPSTLDEITKALAMK